MIGRKLKTAPLLQKVWANGSLQTLRFESAVDQLDRLGSAAPLSRLPVIVVATTTVAAVLADWRGNQIPFIVRRAVRAGNRLDSVPDRQAGEPATSAIAAAA